MVEPQMPDVSSSARLVRIAPPGEGTRTAFFIRDTTETVRRFGRTPGIAGRFQGVDWREEVLTVAIAIRVRTPTEPVFYDLWLNLHDTDTRTALMVDLAVQPALIFQFFGDGGCTLTACTMNNPFREFARSLLHQLERYGGWTIEQYHRAETELRRRCATPAALWDALAQPPPDSPLINPVPRPPSSI